MFLVEIRGEGQASLERRFMSDAEVCWSRELSRSGSGMSSGR